MSKPMVQQRPSGKEGVHPFEIATTAATPKEDKRARESFMIGIEGIQEEVKKNRDEEAIGKTGLKYSDPINVKCRRQELISQGHAISIVQLLLS